MIYRTESGHRIETGDDFTGRIVEEYKCAKCGKTENADEVIWIEHNPYHIDCAPDGEMDDSI